MTVAEAFAGLVELDPKLLGVHEDIVSMIPTFTSGDPRNDPRPDNIMFLRGAASAPTAKHIGNGTSLPGPVPDDKVVEWYARLSAGASSSVRYIPTFAFGRSGHKLYMNVITVRRFTSIWMRRPDRLDPIQDPAAFYAWAHTTARGQGFMSGTPSFLIEDDQWEILGFTGDEVVPGRGYGRGWVFEEFPAHTDSRGIAVTTERETTLPAAGRLVVFAVPGEEVWQHRRGADSDASTRIFPRPGEAVRDRWQGPLPTMVSASRTADPIQVAFGDFALFVAERPVADPAAFTLEMVAGRMPADTGDRTSGVIGAHTSLAPDGSFVVAHQTLPVGRSVDLPSGTDEATESNLVVVRRDPQTAVWRQEVIDGDSDADGRMLGAVSTSAVVSDHLGVDHIFYSLRAPTGGGGVSHVLRHAMGVGSFPQWRRETLDGAGQSTPPAVPGTGRTRAAVGLNATATMFDGKIWVVYEDRTYGNLRCAVGTPIRQFEYDWTFSVVDGIRGRYTTTGPVTSAALVAWENRLSVLYLDQEREVLRHAWREAGGTSWRYEVLDGAGGVGRRVRAKVGSVVGIAAGRGEDGAPRRPVHAVYTVDRSAQPEPVNNIRVATLGW